MKANLNVIAETDWSTCVDRLAVQKSFITDKGDTHTYIFYLHPESIGLESRELRGIADRYYEEFKKNILDEPNRN